MVLLFMGTIVVIALLRPGSWPARAACGARGADPAARGPLGPLVVFAVIMGSIYTGWATVTESAALSVIVALSSRRRTGR